ncbi:MAG: MFS transporter [Candidatus Hodarchaeales archaeon]|jgi:MFS family permease
MSNDPISNDISDKNTNTKKAESIVNPGMEEEIVDRGFLRAFITIIGIGVAFTGLNLIIYFDANVLPHFLNELISSSNPTLSDLEVNSIQSTTFSLAKAVYSVVYLVALVIFGTYSDHFRSPFGNRLPIMFFGAVLTGGSYILGPFLMHLIEPVVIPLIIVNIGTALGIACIWAPGYALISELFTREQRGWASMVMALMTAIGPFFGIGFNFILNSAPDLWSINEFTFVMATTGGILIFFVILTFLLVPKRNPKKKPKESTIEDILKTPAYLLSMGSGSKDSAGDKSVTFMFLVQICWGTVTFILLTYFGLLIIALGDENYPIGMNNQEALLLLGISGLLLAAPIGIMINTFGKTRTAMIGSISLGLAAFLIAQEFMWHFFGLLTIIVIAGGATVIISAVTIAMPADIVPRGKEGQFMGLFILAASFPTPIVAAGSAVIIGLNENPLIGYGTLFLFATVLLFLALGFLTFVHYEDTIQNEYRQAYRKYEDVRNSIRRIGSRVENTFSRRFRRF